MEPPKVSVRARRVSPLLIVSLYFKTHPDHLPSPTQVQRDLTKLHADGKKAPYAWARAGDYEAQLWQKPDVEGGSVRFANFRTCEECWRVNLKDWVMIFTFDPTQELLAVVEDVSLE